MFLPTTSQEMIALGWDRCDVILVTGDTYIDSPYSGIAVIGKVLADAGFKVGIIAQPAVNSAEDITRLGEPVLFWGVSGGTVDSMVANYTATHKKRRSDDFTPGGLNNRRPDRAVIAYTNLIKRFFKNTAPIVLGGIEASLRRITHYDYWDDRLRAPILFDSKADFLLYGMAEGSVLELAQKLKTCASPLEIPGLCYLSKETPDGYIILPSFEETLQDKRTFAHMYNLFYRNNDPLTARGLAQKKGDRFLIHNPPPLPPTTAQLDHVYELEYERSVHPFYAAQGEVKALETIRFSIPTHRGCYGECNFCAIAVHEGRTVSSRSSSSILQEARQITGHPQFRGVITDLSGPTANMYEIECAKKLHSGACQDKRCLYPDICPVLKVDHEKQIKLLRDLRQIPGIKRVNVGSGIRYDMVLSDQINGDRYLREVTEHHTSGQLKVAPEHSEPAVLALMGKPSTNTLITFKKRFEQLSHEMNKKQYLTYYFIAAYPGCSETEMKKLHNFVSGQLHLTPEQVQIFTPTPSTYGSIMYYTEMDPFTGQPIFVEKNLKAKQKQKDVLSARSIYPGKRISQVHAGSTKKRPSKSGKGKH
jgi:uncharacterized radical SAM protein YgiQ